MTAPINPALASALPSPIMEAVRWVEARTFSEDLPLLSLAQAAPSDPPHQALRQAMADAALNDPTAHFYGAVLGDDELRDAIAARWSRAYEGEIHQANVAVTAGCNQAFCAAIASLAQAGDEIILPSPWYFNHRMWLDMAGITTVPLPAGETCLPDPETARALITDRTRAIVLVTPNNPTGAVYPPELIDAFATVARENNMALILDETYRDYIPPTAPHNLFQRADWGDVLIHLYSFSKLFRLTGHRTGAMIASAERIEQIEKFLDTNTICPARMGQIAALAGLASADEFAAAERAEFAARKAALEAVFADEPGGWRLLSAGAYFAYVAHPFDEASDVVAKALVDDQAMLILPGTMFGPRLEDGGDGMAEHTCRIAFANVGPEELSKVGGRLRAFKM
ncbi:MAG: aminotransferase [Pikeienuella sp.]